MRTRSAARPKLLQLTGSEVYSAILPGNMLVAEALRPDIGSSPELNEAPRFSDFLQSQHLHAPTLRLIYRPNAVRFTFDNVPNFPEGWAGWTQYISADASVADIIEQLVDSVGATRVVVQGTKTSRVEYALQLRGEQGATATSRVR